MPHNPLKRSSNEFALLFCLLGVTSLFSVPTLHKHQTQKHATITLVGLEQQQQQQQQHPRGWKPLRPIAAATAAAAAAAPAAAAAAAADVDDSFFDKEEEESPELRGRAPQESETTL